MFLSDSPATAAQADEKLRKAFKAKGQVLFHDERSSQPRSTGASSETSSAPPVLLPGGVRMEDLPPEVVRQLMAGKQPLVPDGTAQVRFRMPQRSTRWMLIARGVTPGTLLGGAKAKITSRAEFQLELLFPSELMAGDEPSPSVRIHDLVGLGDELRSGRCLRSHLLLARGSWTLSLSV